MKTKSKNDICRCPWVDLSKLDYVEYHDKEWGVPVYDDRLIFEFLTLESAQAGLSWYNIWGFVGGKPKINNIRQLSDYPAISKESDALSKDLKNRGFKFLGSTICYAHMQATGMVNDHSHDCFRKIEIIQQYGK